MSMSAAFPWRLRASAVGLAFGVLLGLADPSWAQLITLNANPGPSNNGGGSGWAIFFDLSSPVGCPVIVEQMTTASTAAANATYTVEVFTRIGTALGGPVGQGPGSSTAGWTSLGTAIATQGPTSNGVSLPIDIPNFPIFFGQPTGVAVLFTGAGPRYFGTGSPPYGTYSDTCLTLVTGDARSVPFTPTGSWFASRELVGAIMYSIFPVELMSFEVQ